MPLLGLLVILFYACLFLLDPIEAWLKGSYLKRGRWARLQQRFCQLLIRAGIISNITLPRLRVTKLLERRLPTGFTVRDWRKEDREACLHFYRLLEPGRFPPNDEHEFTSMMDRDRPSMLVIEHEGVVVACGGISLSDIGATLFYGLIHPDFHRRGLGRLLLVSRLARLSITQPMLVLIYAIESSISYYEQFDFAKYTLWLTPDGQAHPQARVYVYPEDVESIRGSLKGDGYPILPTIMAFAPPVPQNAR